MFSENSSCFPLLSHRDQCLLIPLWKEAERPLRALGHSTDSRLCHAAGISLGQRGQRDPYGVTKQVGLSFRRNLSEGAQHRIDRYRTTEPRLCHAGSISLERSGAERPLRGDKAGWPVMPQASLCRARRAERPFQGDRTTRPSYRSPLEGQASLWAARLSRETPTE